MTTYTVGPGQEFSTIAAAVAATQDGDTVMVQAGTYTNDFITTSHKITLQSVGGMATLAATVAPSNGKGIITEETDLTVDGFAFTGAAVADNNGAGIRYEGGNLTVENSLFSNNQDGILATPITLDTGNITITGSEFNHNGAGDGYSHNIYIGEVASLNIDNSYFHDAVAGHEVKSRALATTITNSRIQDNTTGTASYDVDLPDGGTDVLDNDVIQKGPDASTNVSIHTGGDGAQYSNSSLSVTNSTLISDYPGAYLLYNQTPTASSFSGDQLYGYQSDHLANGPATFTNDTTLTTEPTLNTAPPTQPASNPAPADPLIDAAYIDAHYPAAVASGMDAATWYNTIGWQQGANPDAYFDTNYYLTQNPDVKAAGANPLLHFELYGWKEGREPSLVFSDATYLQVYRDVAAAGADPLLHYVIFGQHEGRMTFLTGGTATADPLVNAAYYDQQLGATIIPTGTAAAQQAAYSYETTGWQQNLNPDQFFNAAYYLAHNPDVAAAHVDPLLHYEQYGWKEGRNPSALFDTNAYLNANPDVKAAGVDPLLHYVVFGQTEGRPIYAAPT
jgi:hypothetical protein